MYLKHWESAASDPSREQMTMEERIGALAGLRRCTNCGGGFEPSKYSVRKQKDCSYRCKRALTVHHRMMAANCERSPVRRGCYYCQPPRNKTHISVIAPFTKRGLQKQHGEASLRGAEIAASHATPPSINGRSKSR